MAGASQARADVVAACFRKFRSVPDFDKVAGGKIAAAITNPAGPASRVHPHMPSLSRPSSFCVEVEAALIILESDTSTPAAIIRFQL